LYENLEEVLESWFGSGYLRIVFPQKKFLLFLFLVDAWNKQQEKKKCFKNSCGLVFILQQ